MKAYKIKENTGFLNLEDKDRILVKTGDSYLLIATPVVTGRWVSARTVYYMNEKSQLIEIDLKDEKRSHPHLRKDIKKILQESLVDPK